MSQKSRRIHHVGPLAGLCFIASLIFLHTFSSPSSTIGMANTDTEGTIWWIWSQCKGHFTSGYAQHIAFPHGFDASQFATYNLIDHWRILFAKAQGCSTDSIIISFSLLPAITFVSNLIAGYFVGWQFFRTRSCAFLFAVFAVASSDVLLATRTPLANNVLVPGLLALGFVFRQARFPTSSNLRWAGMLVGLQMLCNAYNGFAFAILAIGFSVGILWNSRNTALRDPVQSWPLAVGALVGSLPLVGSQLYLVTDRLTGDKIRPVRPSDQLLDPLGLISRPYEWLAPLLPEGLPRVEAGWVTLPIVIGVSATVIVLLLGKNLLVPRGWIYTSMILSVLLALIIYRLPNLSFLSKAYFAVLFPLRGVGNYAKFLPVLLSFVAVAAFQLPLNAIENRPFHIRWMLKVLPILLALFSLSDSIPYSRSFYERTSLTPVQDFYRQVSGSGVNTVSAHYPDFTYDREWGFPIRFIQLAQMFTGDTLANGRDFNSRYDKNLVLPTPVDKRTLNFLLDRNVSRIYLHRDLMVPNDFDAAVTFLSKMGFVRRDFVTDVSNRDSELLRSLNVAIFDLREN